LFLSSKIKFSVTPKGTAQTRSRFILRVAAPHIIMAMISLIALGVGIK